MFDRKDEMKDSDVLVIAKSILASYSESHCLARSLVKECGKRRQIALIGRSLSASGAPTASLLPGLENRNLRELLRMIFSGIDSGADISKPLSLFVRDLERRISETNRIKSKTGGSQALTLMGMSLFFPLFAGISEVIMSGSLGMLGDSAPASASAGFVTASAAYIPIMLYLSSAFAHPERGAVKNMISIAPYVCVAAIVSVAARALVGSIL
jgi:hypothetical protein